MGKTSKKKWKIPDYNWKLGGYAFCKRFLNWIFLYYKRSRRRRSIVNCCTTWPKKPNKDSLVHFKFGTVYVLIYESRSCCVACFSVELLLQDDCGKNLALTGFQAGGTIVAKHKQATSMRLGVVGRYTRGINWTLIASRLILFFVSSVISIASLSYKLTRTSDGFMCLPSSGMIFNSDPFYDLINLC